MAVKFEIYRDGQRVEQFTPVGAVALGSESVPIPGRVTCENGILAVDRPDDNAVALGLLWDMGLVGTYFMETTRLIHREQPYNLNVELARFRLMKIVQKQEDWNLFDFPRAEKYQLTFKEAQSLFATALGKLDVPVEAAKLADQALAMAMDLSEQLATFHAELLINRRRTSGQFVKHIFGCRVDSSVQNQRYKDMLAGNFDYAVLPMPWRQVQPEERVFETSTIDEWVDYLSRKRVPIIAGPLIQLNEQNVPDWMFIWEQDYDNLRELAYEYVQKMVHRYRKQVAIWNVVAGLSANSIFHMNFEQVIELTRLFVSQVKNILPSAKTLVTITQPFGEYHSKGGSTVPPLLYAEMAAQSGVNFDAFGLEIEMGVPQPDRFVRDLFQLSMLLDRFSTLGRPVFLTAINAPGRNTPDGGDTTGGQLDPAAGGKWHRPWDPQVQADWMEAVYRLALSKPYVESIAWGNLADVNQTYPGGGLLDDILQPKPAFTRLQEMRKSFQPTAKPK